MTRLLHRYLAHDYHHGMEAFALVSVGAECGMKLEPVKK